MTRRAHTALMALAGLALALLSLTPAAAQTNQCATAYNGICEDPALGGPGLCPVGADRADCTGRARTLLEPDALYGYDDRQLMDTSVQPWSLIGQLEFDDGRACSGVLIDERTVLSAAHCVLAEDGLAFDGVFETARDYPGGPFQARVVDAHVMEMLAEDAEITDLLRENIDWALLRLDRPLGAELGYLPVEVVRDNRPLRRDLISFLALVIITAIAAAATHGRTRQVLAVMAAIGAITLSGFAYRTVFGYDPRNEVIWQAGYSWDTAPFLSGHAGCALLEFRESGLIGHQCDTVSGDSGSPLLVRRDEGWAVIGVVSHSRTRWVRASQDGRRVRRADRDYAVSAAMLPDPDAIFDEPQ